MHRDAANATRFRRAAPRGHYESWFQRANHPTEPRAFWIRYTIFAPREAPDRAVGELWAVYFDGTSHTAVKSVFGMSDCTFSDRALSVQIGRSTLGSTGLQGAASTGPHEVAWDLSYTSPQPPLLLLKRRYYRLGFPKAKSLVGAPGAVFSGTLRVDDRTVDVRGWRGSQNHNWGSQHTDRYAWGQVAGFDDDPGAFLECATGQIAVGGLMSPPMTLIVLRLDGSEYRMNGLRRSLLVARGSYDFFRWTLSSRRRGVRIEGAISAPSSAFVGLPYDNPPGGTKTCLNSKLAACELRVERRGMPTRTLRTGHRAAFEILTDRDDHGVSVLDAPLGRGRS